MPGDDARSGGVAAIHAMRSGGADLEERGTGIEQVRHPFPGGHLAARDMAGERFLAAPGGGAGGGLGDGGEHRLMRRAVGAERRRRWTTLVI